MQIFNRLILMVLTVLLTACSTVGPQLTSSQRPADWTKRQAQLLRLQHWTTVGAVGMRTSQAAWSASFNWQQQANNYRLQLLAPLGAGTLLLAGNAEQVELSTSKGEHYQASDTQALLYERTGWYLPVERLRYWIRGIPAPGIPAKLNFDNQQRLASLEQQDWQVQYPEFVSVNGLELPKILILTNPYFKIRVVVKQWTLV